MAEIKVRPYLTIRPTPVKGGGMSAYYVATVKGLNRMGGVVESMGKHLEMTNKLLTFRNEFLIQSQAQRIKLEQKGIKLDEAEEKKAEDKNRKWWRKYLDKKSEDEAEKQSKKPEKAIDVGAKVIKKAVSPLKKFFQQFSSLFEAFIRFTVVTAILDWISGTGNDKLAKFIGNVIKVFSFVRKLTGFGIGTLLDGLTNLFGGFDKITKGNILGAFQGLLGVGQLLAGVALVKGAQYIMMPWKLISDVTWVVKLFTDMGKATGEAEGVAKNKDIVAYVDKNGNQISKEDFENAKKSAARNDAKRSKKQGKGWQYSGGSDAVTDRYRAQYGKKNKNFLQKGAQRTRIGFNRATKGVRGGFKAAGNWMEANPAKGNAIFSVVGGLARAGGGLMSGENAGQAVGAGLGQATGGIAGFALGNMLLPGVGGIIGSALGSFLGEWVGTKLGPIIDPIMKPIGNAFKLGFDIIGMAVGPIINDFGEMLGALVDGLGAIIGLCGWIAKAGAEVIKFAWENSIYKKAIDGMIWVWKNKDNIGKAVGEALTQGAKGTLDALTFNVFDFDKQNKKFAGGRVPLMAMGGQIQTDTPEVMGLKIAGSALVSTVEATLDSFGLVGSFAKMALSSDLGRLKGTFGTGGLVGAAGGQKIAAQVTKPTKINQGGNINGQTSSNAKLESIVGTKDVKFLTEQPNKFSPMNDGSMRGLLADIYNGLVSLNVLGGDSSAGTGPGGASDIPMPAGSATDLVSGAKIFMELGLSPLAASYMSGNVQQESGWKGQRKPWVLNDGAGTNKGLISWNRGRLTNAEKFLGKPLEKASNAEQARWILQEMKTSYKNSWAIVSNPKASKEDLKKAIYWYIGWGHEGARWKYGDHAYKAITGSTKQAALGGLIPLMDGGGEYTVDGKPKDPRRRRRFEDKIKKFAAGGALSKLGDGTSLASAPRGYCTTGVLETMAKNGVPNPPGTGSDGNNPRGLMVQMIKSYGWGSMPYGKPVNLNSPYGKVGANMMNYQEWSKNVKAGNIPSGALVFSTRNANWNSNGPSSGHDSAIAKKGGAKLWSGHWQAEVNGVGSVYGTGTKSIIALTPGGQAVKYDPSRSGDEGSTDGTTTTTAGGGKTSLLGSSEGKDPGTILEEAFRKFKDAFGGGQEVKPEPAKPTQPKANPSATPSSTSTSRAVQTGSEQYTSDKASTPTGGVAVAPVVVPMNQQQAQAKPNIVVNSPAPTAMAYNK